MSCKVSIETKARRGQALDSVDVYRIITKSSAQTAPIIQKIAYVDLNSERSVANISLGEAVARDHGVNVRAFPTVQAAEQWLAAELGIP
jgi:hypothetical protein